MGKSIRLFAVLALCVAGAAGARAGAPSPVILTVYTTGPVPGLSDARVADDLATWMTALKLEGWRFVAGSPTAPMAEDRMEWKFKPLPYAGETWARYGRLLSSKQDFFGRYRYLKVEVRLYVGGEYQTMSFKTAEVQGGENDPKLAALVRDLGGPLLTVGLNPNLAPDHSNPSQPKPMDSR